MKSSGREGHTSCIFNLSRVQADLVRKWRSDVSNPGSTDGDDLWRTDISRREGKEIN
jgi:hypothetical protein